MMLQIHLQLHLDPQQSFQLVVAAMFPACIHPCKRLFALFYLLRVVFTARWTFIKFMKSALPAGFLQDHLFFFHYLHVILVFQQLYLLQLKLNHNIYEVDIKALSELQKDYFLSQHAPLQIKIEHLIVVLFVEFMVNLQYFFVCFFIGY